MDTKHTPGPWYFSSLTEGSFLIQAGTGLDWGHWCIGKAHSEHLPPDSAEERWREARSNASLIAAAPDLLEALRKAADALEAVYESEMEWTGEWDMLPPDALELAKAAIRKAEGE